MYKLRSDLQVYFLKEKLVTNNPIDFEEVSKFTNNDNSFISSYISRLDRNVLYHRDEYCYLVKCNNIIKEVYTDIYDLLLKAKEIDVMYLTHDNINEVAEFCNGIVSYATWDKDYSSVMFKTKENTFYTSCVINNEYFIKCDDNYVFCLKEELFNFLLEEVKDN